MSRPKDLDGFVPCVTEYMVRINELVCWDPPRARQYNMSELVRHLKSRRLWGFSDVLKQMMVQKIVDLRSFAECLE